MRFIVSIALGNDAVSAQDRHVRPLIEQNVVTVTISVHAAPTVSPVIVEWALDERRGATAEPRSDGSILPATNRTATFTSRTTMPSSSSWHLAGSPGRRLSPAERFLLLGRTLGRALAHEFGHYLLRSRGHATNGLMKGRRTVKEFIDPNRHGFDIDAFDREAAARRIREIARELERATIVG